MPSKSEIGRPILIYPRNLRHLSHAQFNHSSPLCSDFSVNQTASIRSLRTYASARLEEKQREELHASGGTWIELFYDLFFAASIGAFSRTREISGKRDLIDLTAFFTVLWWTWTSQTLFDVRYSLHAKSEKLLKFLQLIVMIGYGVFSRDFTLFDRSDQGIRSMSMAPRHRSSPRTSTIAIAVLFMFSRVTLGAQYLRIAIRRRAGEDPKTQVQNSALISAALPYLAGVFWLTSLFVAENATTNGGVFASRAALWIVGILVEMIGTFAMRLHKRAGFEKSHLSERYGSLTIIILGEGVIKLVASLRDISSGIGFQVKSIITIATAVISFYLIFVLYFDDFSLHERIKSVKAYSWAYMHYLFHLSLVLCLDGITSLLLFTNIFGGIESLISSDKQSDILQYLMNCKTLNASTPLSIGKISLFAYDPLTTMMSLNGTEMSQSQYDYVFINLFERIFQSYSLEPSEAFLEFVADLTPAEASTATATSAFKLLLAQFVVSAKFFLLAGGAIFLTMIPIMYWQKRMWVANWSRWLPLTARLLGGLALMSLGLATDIDKPLMGQLLMAGALIPLFMFTAALIYAVDKLVVIHLQFH